jgi:hypothetical protein
MSGSIGEIRLSQYSDLAHRKSITSRRSDEQAAEQVRLARTRFEDAAVILAQASLATRDPHTAQRLASLSRNVTLAARPFGVLIRTLRGRR